MTAEQQHLKQWVAAWQQASGAKDWVLNNFRIWTIDLFLSPVRATRL